MSGEGPAPTARRPRRQYAQDQFELTSGTYPKQDPAAAGYGTPDAFPPAGGAQTPGYVGHNLPPSGPGAPGAPAGAGAGAYGQTPQMGALADGMARMNVNLGSRLNQLEPVDLSNAAPDMQQLTAAPPPLVLPERASATPSPYANGSPDYVRCTLNAIPTTNGLLKKSKLPFALVLRPYTALRNEDEPVPVVTDQLISRCRRCRAYINPYSQFIEDGHRWRCILCNLINDVPQGFDWDLISNKAKDRWERAELNYSVVDFVAPQEYMARPPQPLVLVFVIDVSYAAVQSGLVATASRTILESLDRIPNLDGRTKVAFVGVDSSLYYFSMSPDTQESQMMVVSDLDEPFLPTPVDLLLNLKESRKGIEQLLERFGDMFQHSRDSGSALGPALKAAHKMISGIGGKIVTLTASLPNKGEGKLDPRDDTKAWGTSKETSLLQTQSSFYKSFAVECSKQQVSVDMFLFASGYQDVASLSCLPRYTGGQTHHYPAWSALSTEDAVKFARELSEHLSMEIQLEAVMRIRGTSNLRMQMFYGNFFNRSSDLCALPSFPRDQGYVVEVAIDDNLSKPYVVLQTAVLHTTCHGERRIRTINIAIPTTDKLSELYASADQVAIVTYLSFRAVERCLSYGSDSAREFVVERLVAMMETFRKQLTGQNTGASLPLQLSQNLKLLPFLCLALTKSIGLRKAQIMSDVRSAALNYLSTFPPDRLIPYIVPRLYSLHNMPDDAGVPTEQGIALPPQLNLTAANFESYGLYLIDDGLSQILWLGKDAVPLLVQDVFGVPSVSQLRGGKMTLPNIEDSAMNQRVNNIMAKLRSLDKGSIASAQTWLVRGDHDPALQKWVLLMLIEDRTDAQPSYHQFITQLKEKVNA